MTDYPRVQPGDAAYELISWWQTSHPQTSICDAIDHNESVARGIDGQLYATGEPHVGCSNPKCWKYREA